MDAGSASASGRTRVRADWRHRRVRGAVNLHGFATIELGDLREPRERQRLLEGLQAHGLAVLTLPRAMGLRAHAAGCYRDAAAFFSRGMYEKAPHAISEECQQGCAIYEDGTEFFEVIQHFDERLWSWPSVPRGFRSTATSAYDCLHAVATQALEALLLALGMDADAVHAVLDPSSSCATLPGRAVVPPGATAADAGASHTALRIWSYAPGAQPTDWHCDNTLLTLGVKGSARGLRVRTLDGRLLCPEEGLADDQVVLYLGDSLSYLSGGRVLPLMHEVVPPSAGAPPRLSMPFFLRARRDALLRPALASPGWPAARALPPLSVVALEEDEGGIKQRWSWKRAPYFAELHGGARS